MKPQPGLRRLDGGRTAPSRLHLPFVVVALVGLQRRSPPVATNAVLSVPRLTLGTALRQTITLTEPAAINLAEPRAITYPGPSHFLVGRAGAWKQRSC